MRPLGAGAQHAMRVDVDGDLEWTRRAPTENPGQTDSMDYHFRRELPPGKPLRIVVKTRGQAGAPRAPADRGRGTGLTADGGGRRRTSDAAEPVHTRSRPTRAAALHYPAGMDKPKPFSMIREFHLADWFTLANAFCGVGALFSVMTFLQTGDVRHICFACWLIPAALVFDVLDGRVARWRQQSSELGRELDSLADVISFGVAPAAIAYGCGMQGLWDRVVLVFFVVCGVSRLARYNITPVKLSRGRRQGQVLRGHADPDLAAAGDRAGRRRGARQRRRCAVGRRAASSAASASIRWCCCSRCPGSLMISRIRIPKLSQRQA